MMVVTNIKNGTYIMNFGKSKCSNIIIDLRFNLSLIKYIAGTKTRVKKVAKNKPKIMVQLNGPQNTTLSPPK
jgi:hypothetical protein